jgi:hypothetical protein
MKGIAGEESYHQGIAFTSEDGFTTDSVNNPGILVLVDCPRHDCFGSLLRMKPFTTYENHLVAGASSILSFVKPWKKKLS